MTDITSWKNVFKISEGNVCTTNMLYVPKVNSEGNVLCMSWNFEDGYSNTNVSERLINYFYQREKENLQLFQQFDWCPRLLEIDDKNKLIFIEWDNMTFNKMLFSDGDINSCSDYKEQITDILLDIDRFGYYKMALYPHCFYSKNGKVKTFDFYGTFKKDDKSIDRESIEELIGKESGHRFDVSTVDGMIQFDKFFEYTLTIHLEKIWKDPFFKEIYTKLCGTK